MKISSFSTYCQRKLARRLHTDVRVRFAPSPTGEIHLGGLRTALYNYLFAKSTRGKFIVRIEDTDRTRIVPGSADRIRNVLSHYGLLSEEDPWKGGPKGPYIQSERLPMYAEHAEQLIDDGHAYRCFCTPERLELLRKNAVRTGSIPMYDRKCRSSSTAAGRERARDGEDHVIRFKLDHQDVHFQDKVFGGISQRLEESDPVLLKSDGFPTYHMACIVDDHLMGISHVIRGMEWLSSTGKHVLLYKALNWQPPEFVHLPLLTRDGKKKLSKRDKDAFVEYYDKELGVLPIALINLLVRNGSGIRDLDPTQLYSLEDLVNKFDVTRIGRRNLQIDAEILSRYAAQAFKAAHVDDVLIPAIRNQLEKTPNYSTASSSTDYLRKVIEFLNTKEEKFGYLAELTKGKFAFFFSRPTSTDKLLKSYSREVSLDVLERITRGRSLLLRDIKRISEEIGIDYPKVLGILRLVLIDGRSGPPISELIDFFGQQECWKRISEMTAMLKADLV